MNIIRWCAAILVAAGPWARAQNQPRIGYVFPAGGQQGATFQAVLGGQFLGGATNVLVSGPGVQGVVLDYARPLTQKEFTECREQLKELLDKKSAAYPKRGQPAANRAAAWTAADEKQLAEVRRKLQNPPNRQGNPAIAETVTLKMTVASATGPGRRELRLETPNGLSNPLVFEVGQLPEFTEQESKTSAAKTELAVTLPATVNGQIMPGDVDRYRFKARKGERLVIAVQARQLIPYLPDAVPGWFQATLALYDARGKELRFDDDFRFNPDPVLYYEVPAEGEYVIEIRDSIYRGREDFVYRIQMGELPFITGVFPLGGQQGKAVSVELKGWNLPVSKLSPDTTLIGGQQLCVTNEVRVSNVVPFAVDALPEVLEQEPNNQVGNAQAVRVPVIINGRIHQPGDTDVFRFEAQAGDELVAEVYARRLHSSLDSVLRLLDSTGRQLAFNDDSEDKAAGLTTHHADSRLRARLPASGSYYLSLSDTQRGGGPEYAYRLRISPPQPDFELRIVPSAINVRAGATVPVTVYALRQDGFSNEIAVMLKDAPRGFSLGGGRVPAGQDQVKLTLTAPTAGLPEAIALHLEGRATIQGREVVHSAVPAEDMMQAFAYRHLVPAQELKVATVGRWSQKAVLRVLSNTPVKIPVGGTARIQVSTPKGSFPEKIRLELSDAPEGITIQAVNPLPGSTEIVLQSDAAKTKPGVKGNLILNAFAPGKTDAPGKTGKQQRPPIATLPAIPFEIVR